MKPRVSNGSRSQMEIAQRRLIESLSARIKDQRVIDAMARTPREIFVPSQARDLAYEDVPVSIGHQQTISQPYIVAMMLAALELQGHETVLEVGTGSGYQAVLLAQLARRVVTVERIAALAKEAEDRIRRLGCRNVRVEVAEGTLGCPRYAPYQGIIVAAAAPTIPQKLLEQVSVGGRMVVPVGGRDEQDLKRVVKLENGFDVVGLGACRFVPLIGEDAWDE